jgi:hypothetical protein
MKATYVGVQASGHIWFLIYTIQLAPNIIYAHTQIIYAHASLSAVLEIANCTRPLLILCVRKTGLTYERPIFDK